MGSVLIQFLILTTYRVLCGSSTTEIQNGPTFINEPPSHVDFHNTTGNVISCSAQGTPTPLVFWTSQDGTPLREIPGLRHVRPDGSLVFPPFRAEDYRQDVHDDIYRCVASNSVGIILSREVQVRAVVPQQYKAQVYDEFVVKGNTAVLRCHVPTFVRDYVIFESWTRGDDVTITSTTNKGGKYFILQTGELYIRNVNQGDSLKSYSCQTRHKLTRDVTSSATSGRLFVTEPHGNSPPRITDSHLFVAAREGDTVQLSCAAESFPLPTYSWFKEEDGEFIPLSANPRTMTVDGILVIQYVGNHDSGKYVCVVNNSVGEEKVTTILTVSAPLSVYIYPQRQVIDVGKAATFNCSITGHPVTSVVWMKDGRPLSESDRMTVLSRDILHISSVQREDKGMYQCFVYNNIESVQGTAELRLGDVAPVFIYTFSEDTMKPGNSLSLKCAASGNPLPQITWSLDDNGIPDHLRYRVGDFVTSEAHVVSYVNVSEVRVEDGGEYSCSANNVVDTIRHSARINVYGSPLIRMMKNISVVAGNTLTIRCPVAGYPIEAITWQRGGLVLPVNHRQKATPEGTLTIENVQRNADQGDYSCVAKNREEEEAKGSVYIFVLVAPMIDPQPLPPTVYANEGMKIKLMCSVLEGDPPVRVVWMKNNYAVTVDTDVTLQHMDDSSVLVFRKVAFRHSGNYTCVASNVAATTNRTTALVVKVPPRWVIEPSNAFVVLNHQVTIDCLADGHPKPRMYWRIAKGEHPSDFRDVLSTYQRRVYDNGTLLIQEVTKLDSGFYLCHANNGIGAGLSKVIYLTVHTPPTFETKFGTHTVAKGEAAILKCEALGESPLSLTWEKDKQLLDPDSDKRFKVKNEPLPGKLVSVLTISQTGRHDSALYTCIVTNKFGSDETNIQLVVQESPSAPVEVKVKETTSRTILVQWSPSFTGNSIITKYIIHYKNLSANWKDSVQKISVSGGDHSATIRGLTPSTTYNIKILAENNLGMSDPSETVTGTTEEEVPGGPPLDVKVQATGSQSLKVTWKPPRKELQYSVIQGYYIGYKIFDSSDSYQYKNVEATEGMTEETTYLTNLKRLTKYIVIVQAYNNVGAGPRSDEVYATTFEAAPPTSPVLVASSTTTFSISVQWERPQDDTGIRDYILHYKSDNGEWQQQKLSTSSNQFTLKGLKCGTRYRLHMTASNSLGTGEPSDSISIRTKGAAPVSPQKEVFLSINTTSVMLHLQSWQSGGCPIQYFSVLYRPKFQRQWKQIAERISAQQQYFEIRHLAPGREYVLRVTAHSEAGTTEAEYIVHTLNISVAAPTIKAMPPMLNKDGTMPFYKNLTVLLPVVISVIVLLIVIITVIVCLRRQTDDSSRGSSGDGQGRKERNSDQMGLTEFSQKGLKDNDPYGKTWYYSSPKRKLGVESSLHRSRYTSADYEKGIVF